MITKEEFCKILNKIKDMYNYRRQHYSLVKSSGLFSDFYPESCEDVLVPEVLRLLKILMNDVAGGIDFFVYDLNFGENYKPGAVTDKLPDGTTVNVDMSSAETLYDYLKRNKEENK